MQNSSSSLNYLDGEQKTLLYFFLKNYLGNTSTGGVNRTDLWTGMLDLQRYVLLNETLLFFKIVAVNFKIKKKKKN